MDASVQQEVQRVMDAHGNVAQRRPGPKRRPSVSVTAPSNVTRSAPNRTSSPAHIRPPGTDCPEKPACKSNLSRANGAGRGQANVTVLVNPQVFKRTPSANPMGKPTVAVSPATGQPGSRTDGPPSSLLSPRSRAAGLSPLPGRILPQKKITRTIVVGPNGQQGAPQRSPMPVGMRAGRSPGRGMRGGRGRGAAIGRGDGGRGGTLRGMDGAHAGRGMTRGAPPARPPTTPRAGSMRGGPRGNAKGHFVGGPGPNGPRTVGRGRGAALVESQRPPKPISRPGPARPFKFADPSGQVPKGGSWRGPHANDATGRGRGGGRGQRAGKPRSATESPLPVHSRAPMSPAPKKGSVSDRSQRPGPKAKGGSYRSQSKPQGVRVQQPRSLRGVAGSKPIRKRPLDMSSLRSPAQRTIKAPEPTPAATGAKLYKDLSKRQSTILEQMDADWSDPQLFSEVSSGASDEESDLVEVLLDHGVDECLESQEEETQQVLLQALNVELPEAYSRKRKSVRCSVKQQDWEGWQRRVKRQTWEEWEIRLSPKPTIGLKSANTSDAIVSQLKARTGDELDGRAVVPYWLLRWWLTKNTTSRPTISKHPLLELLLEDNLSVVSELSKVVKSQQLSRLSICLVRIFDGCAKIIPLIAFFVQDEVSKTAYETTLFRTNTITTKIMSAYAKISGASYLRQHLGPLLQAIILSDTVIEIDLKKLQDPLKLDYNIELLTQKTQQILDAILSTVDRVPFMLRQICACLSGIVKEKFPGAEFFSVAGFMFLRFLCPAIVAPDAFGVVKTAPSPKVRRTLILISKVMQNLANGTEHAKEEYMQPMDVFVELNLRRMREYFSRISDITKVPSDMVDVNFTIIPVPLVEESLTIVHRMIIKHIDVLKEALRDTEVTETVHYNTCENLNTVLLKSSMAIEQLKSGEQVPASSPLFKPYALFIDVLLANGCKVIGTLLQNERSETDRKLIAEELMIVVHTHGNALEFIKTLIHREVAAASVPKLAFLESSLGTWLIFGYFKLLVRDFMSTYWRTSMESIAATNVCTEVDPSRSADVDTEQAFKYLEAVTDQFLEPLVAKAHELPSIMFELCSFMQREMLSKFGAQVGKNFAAHLVCERIFIVAVTYPTLYHMAADLPKFNARRTLLLTSRILRHCFFGGQFTDPSLLSLNQIVDKHQTGSRSFIQMLLTQPPGGPETLALSWTLQRQVLISLYSVLKKELETLKIKLQENETMEHITYNIFDRLAAVIALYRYRLRVRTQTYHCETVAGAMNEYSDAVKKS